MIDDEVLVGGLGDLLLDLAAGGVVGDAPVRSGEHTKTDHAALLGDGVQSERLAVDGDVERGRRAGPSPAPR